MRRQNHLLLIGLAFAMAACHHESVEPDTEKLGIHLRKILAYGNHQQIHISGECRCLVSDSIAAILQKTGISLQTVTGNHFTALGTNVQIVDLAAMDVVLRLRAGTGVKLLSE